MLVYIETFLFLVARSVGSFFLWEGVVLFFQTVKKTILCLLQNLNLPYSPSPPADQKFVNSSEAAKSRALFCKFKSPY